MDNILEALLNTMPTADGRDDEFEELWDQVLATRPKLAAQSLGPIITTGKGTAPSMAQTPARTTASRRVPKVGTKIERSTATNARKTQALLETPSPRRVHGIIRSRPVTFRRIQSKETRETLTELFGGTLRSE